MTIHDLINTPGTSVDTTGRSCITALIDADSICYILGWHHRERDDTPELEEAIDRFINDLLLKTQARQYAGFFSDKKTFRHELYPAYKATRKPPHPGIQKWKPFITEYCMQNWNFIKVENLEADDAVARMQRSMDNTVICSPDKDLRQIPGNHYDYKKDQHLYISEEVALYNWGYQMIVGDTGDNIKGIPGHGPKAAERILKDVNGPVIQDLVKEAYKLKFNDYEQFHLHCQLIGVGLDSQVPLFHDHLHTFDLDNAAPSNYLSPSENVGQEAEDLFGSW